MADDPRVVRYHFRFDSGETRSFHVPLDATTLSLITQSEPAPPAWTALGHHQCPHCPLLSATHPHCPVAKAIAPAVSAFADFVSYDDADVTVETPDRTYQKRVPVQKGMSALLGVYMATSGCPVMDHLKPMVRFHLPFASTEETLYRAISMYLVAQLLLHEDGQPAQWSLRGLSRIYHDVQVVNQCMVQRLQGECVGDATANALINLDCFAAHATFQIDQATLSELRQLFAAYLA
ncbi:MAG: hypothetical protein HYV02_06370 [Deltaproteobacteria bacterium]|nr:hypothetical protein [Deltaproteobacteria bacterium]